MHDVFASLNDGLDQGGFASAYTLISDGRGGQESCGGDGAYQRLQPTAP
jgi:hypothetical protein